MTGGAPSARIALSVAGSDPSGGAGIQADLKTFAAFEVYGAAAITCATAQNTRGVRAIHALPPEFVAAEIEAVLDDLPVGAAKTGMLGSAALVEAVAHVFATRPVPALVVDPVMVATSGDRLLDREAEAVLVRRLLPLATVATPNLQEAFALAGRSCADDDEKGLRDVARAIAALGPAAVLVKGGHRRGTAQDLLLDADGFAVFEAERLPVGPTHGSGCTLSAAITAGLAAGCDLRGAIATAKAFVLEAIRSAPAIGGGARPLDHLVRPVRSRGPAAADRL